MATSEADQPETKTELILSLIAEQGPKTEYDLYKQLPKLSHGTIHFCLNKLTEGGLITYTATSHKGKRAKKQYYLTFIGTVSYVASFLHWLDAKTTDDDQIEKFWQRFDKEYQKQIIEFLYTQGQLLKYAPFQEIKWLNDLYPNITRLFLIIANEICRDLPSPYRNPLLAALVSGAEAKHDPAKEKGAGVEKESKNELMELEQEAFRRRFTELFFELIAFMKHNNKPTANHRLHQLAEEQLETKRRETIELERALKLFSKSKDKQ